MRRIRLGFKFISCFTLACLLLTPGTFAQDVTESALKAAFIYNFAKFTEWPADVAGAEPFGMCVLGDAAVGDALERAIVGRVLGARPLVMSRVVTAGAKRACQVLYVSGMSAAQAGSAIADLRDVPVLTISDVDGFIEVGGIAQFFFEHGQLRFRIQLESARRARLQISSRLLIMAKTK